MSAIYWDLLVSVESAVASLDGFLNHSVRIFREPRFEPALHTVGRSVVIAPDPSLAERIDDERFEGGADLAYRVYVGFNWPREMDRDSLRYRLERRAEIYKRLWVERGFLASGRDFDVGYIPDPGISGVAWPNSDESWQAFDITVSAERNS